MRAALFFSSLVALALPLAGAGAGGAVDVVAKISVGKKPCAAAAGFGAVWVTHGLLGQVSRIDPQYNDVSPPIDVAGTAFGSRQWAGSAQIVDDKVYSFYTASGHDGGGVDPNDSLQRLAMFPTRSSL